ncbi:hypothetical protein BT69DRAFT_1346670 [Atractiella rhizophila]|nr:hypothetical protein BT69DRAFT_1346670 [Atractiella rhizophila]
MPTHYCFLFSALLVTLFAPALAVFDVGGTICTGIGSLCIFAYLDANNIEVTVTGYCAPNLRCGDNGAVCDTAANCYNYCGDDGICGGVGALCDTTDPFEHDQETIACNTPASTCDISVGLCISAASPGSRRTREAKREMKALKEARETCSGDEEDLCFVNGRFRCIDAHTSLESCGACAKEEERGGGQDCASIDGADSVACVQGKCVVSTCLPGYALVDGKSCILAE